MESAKEFIDQFSLLLSQKNNVFNINIQIKELDRYEKIVRCCDCKHGMVFGDFEDNFIRCTNLCGNPIMPNDGFCSYGEERKVCEISEIIENCDDCGFCKGDKNG